MPPRKHGIIIAGGGGRGIAFVNLLEKELNRRVVAIAEVNPARRHAVRRVLADWNLAHIGVQASFAEALCRHPRAEADVVFVMTPETSHLDIFRQAVRADCHVFLEKPLAASRRDVLAIARLARATDKTIQVGFVLRCAAVFQRLKDLVAAGTLGRLVMIELHERLSLQHGAFYCRNWRRKTANTGGFLNEKCSHDMDILGWLKEGQAEPVSVLSYAGRHYTPPRSTPLSCNRCRTPVCPWRDGAERCVFHTDKDVYDHQSVIVRFADDTQAVFTVNAFSARPGREIRLFGTDGYLESDLENGAIRLREYWKDTVLRDLSIPATDEHGGGDVGLVAGFMESVERHERPLVSIEAGARASLLAFAADESARRGRAVHVGRLFSVRQPNRLEWCAPGGTLRHLAVGIRDERGGALRLKIGNPYAWPLDARLRLSGTGAIAAADAGAVAVAGQGRVVVRLAPFESREFVCRGRPQVTSASGAPAADAVRAVKHAAEAHLALFAPVERIPESALEKALQEIGSAPGDGALLHALSQALRRAYDKGDYLEVCRMVSGWRMVRVERMLHCIANAGGPALRAGRLRVNCGGDRPCRSAAGRMWRADQPWLGGLTGWGYVGGDAVDRGSIPIRGTDVPDLYRTERYGMRGYRFRAPNGRYRIRLYFAETLLSGPGQRTFGVAVQDRVVAAEFDPAAAAGGSRRSTVLSFDAAVVDGVLRIDFQNASAAEINGIAIVRCGEKRKWGGGV